MVYSLVSRPGDTPIKRQEVFWMANHIRWLQQRLIVPSVEIIFDFNDILNIQVEALKVYNINSSKNYTNPIVFLNKHNCVSTLLSAKNTVNNPEAW